MVNRFPFLILILTVISILIIFLQFGEVNRDGVLYLTQAQFMLEGNWEKAKALYDWNFFTLLIFLVNSITGVSIQYSAHIIDGACFILAAVFFLKNIEFISRGKIPPIYGLLILLTSIPLMDDYLSMILRDHGQWAGFMLGVYAYLRWIENQRWSWAVLWQFGFLFGALFRPETMLFNILLPLTHQLFLNPAGRLKSLLQSISLALFGFVALGCLWVLAFINFQNIELARLNELITRPQQFLLNITQPLQIVTDSLYLRLLLADFALSFKYFFFSYVLIYKWISGVGLLHFGLFFIALKQKLIKQPFAAALFIFLSLSGIITAINLYTTHVIANRYWCINWWIVYIFATFGLHHIWHFLKKSKYPHKKWFQYSLAVILSIYFLNILIDKPKKHFEQEAGDWIKQQRFDLNNIYFNDPRAAFYSGLIAIDLVSFDEAINVIQYDYLMLRYNRFDEIKPIENYEAIKFFPTEDKPKLVIYQRVSHV